jgi:hypothetical protein
MQLRSTRRAILAATVAFCALGLSFSAQALVPHWNGDRLQVTAPSLHFLSGKALDRLHDGLSIPYAFQMTLTTLPRSIALQRTLDRFVVSYDVWGERFKIVQSNGPRRAVANLTANAAETWCVEQMSVPSGGVPADRDLWLRLEIRAEEPVQSPITETGLSLTSLIEIFGRRAPAQTQEWSAETQPFRLASVRR